MPTTTTPSTPKDRDGSRRLAVDRGRDHQRPAGLQRYRDDGLALSNDGKPVPSLTNSLCGLIPKGAKNIDVGQGFPQIFDPAGGSQRVFEDRARPPRTADAVDREEGPVVARPQGSAPGRLHHAGPAGPDGADVLVYNPAYAQVENEHVWQTAWADIMRNGTDAAAAADKAFKRIEADLCQIPDHAKLKPQIAEFRASDCRDESRMPTVVRSHSRCGPNQPMVNELRQRYGRR